MHEKFISVVCLFDEKLQRSIRDALTDDSEEVRLRTGHYAEIVNNGSYCHLPVICTDEDIRTVIKRAMRFSMFANEDNLREGWICLQGGHRLAFCGRAVRKNGVINSMDSFSSVNIRLAKEKKGASENIMPYIKDNGGQVISSLIISPPGVGKTTLLRDIARVLSSGKNALKVSVADERGEIACCMGGVPTLDIGERCDILDRFDKGTAINMSVRLMSPDVIITDEIGSEGDMIAICDASVCGVKIIASAHGNNINDFFQRNHMKRILESSAFDRFIFIQRERNILTAGKVYDRNLSEVRM